MAVIKCKMCGGDIELSSDKTFGVCECCGSTMTFPKIDDDQRAAAFNRGNYFRRIGEFDKALAVYERIVEEDNTDAEAHWCCALCRYGIEYVEDPTSHEYLPTCHRASFDNFLEDVDYQAALQYSDGITKRQYEKDAAKIAEVQHGILATCQNEQPFDVFICYKESDENGSRTKDSTLAQEIYYQLTDQGRRVFFARITLEDKVGTEYEPYIFAALNSAKVMIVVGTKPEYFNAVWVKNEWSRFLATMKKDRSKLLLPCYRDMDPYDLPEALSVLQSYDMAKIGFMQDLTRGIGKVLDAGKPAPAKQETVVVQNVANTNVTAQVKRGNLALADGDWEQARTFFNQALDMDAECAEAYLGLALAEAKAQDLDVLRRKQIGRIKAVEPITQEVPFKDDATTAALTARDSLKEEVVALCGEFYRCDEFDSIFEYDDSGFTYVSSLSGMKDTLRKEQAYYMQDRYMDKAVRFAKSDTANMLKAQETALNNEAAQCIAAQEKLEDEKVTQLQNSFDEFLKAAKESGRQKRDEIEADLESQYQYAIEKEKSAKTLMDYHAGKEIFQNLHTYKDANGYAENCETKENLLKAQRKKKRRRLVSIAIVAVAVVTSICFVVTLVIVPQGKYKEAETLYNNRQYQMAAAAFQEAGIYRDSKRNFYRLISYAISAGENRTVSLRADGTVVSTGWNSFDLRNWQDIVAISSGNEHVVGLKSDGTMLVAGRNKCGQCNVGDWQDIVAVSAGSYHTVGLKSDGTVVATGWNKYGQRDVDDWNSITAVDAGGCLTVGLKYDGTVVTIARYNIGGWKNIIAVSAGDKHIVGLKSDGTVLAIGNSEFEQCNVNDWRDIVAISAGSNHTVGLKSDGTVVAVGINQSGQCDVSDWQDIIAISAGGNHTVGLKSDGTVVAVGQNGKGQCNVSTWNNIGLAQQEIEKTL